MLIDLERLLRERNIPSHRDGNSLRCFPHVVNISVKHGLAALTEASLKEDPDYAAALSNDPVKLARQLVTACRASGQCRADFAAVITDVITDGNHTGAFGEGKTLRQVQLKRDVDTRWSSTLELVDRLLELYLAVVKFMEDSKQADIWFHLPREKGLPVLQDIRKFLHLPHLVQEFLSAEQTPTAPKVLPVFERLLTYLKLARVKYAKIAHCINASITALEEYLRCTRQTRVYALAMGTSSCASCCL
ncbi:hypothetical protein BD413DRAFT_478343 [Trametes elegans]|nr:hypothetical protein BD413DRAFT_478343 [Trametes elegans]